MPTSATWLLPVLNSDLVEFLLCQITNTLRGGFLRLIYQYVNQVPIITPDRSTQREFVAIARSGVGGKPVDDDKLNGIVYNLYGLSPTEVRLVEEWFERRGLGGNG